MSIRIENPLPKAALQFLRRCYRFVSHEWQHAAREPLPDQGFEERFRESCVIHLTGWNVAPEREMHLGSALDTASGMSHEVDIVCQCQDVIAVLEIKNRPATPPEKNDVIVFFAKLLDYLALNSTLLLKEVCPAFMSSITFEEGGLAACLGLGIHPIAPGLRPLPILVENARLIDIELQKGVIIAPELREECGDFCANLNRLSVTLSDTWLSSRCGYQSERTIVLRAVERLETVTLARELRRLNGDCERLLDRVKKAKSESLA